jgi:ribosomal protein S15P/S13E
MKEKIEKLIEKYNYKRERYNRLIYRPGFMTGDLRDFYDGVIEEYDFIKGKLNSLLPDYDPCIVKIQLALIIQMAFNHYRHVTFPSNKKDIGKNRALSSIIEDMRELVKE